MSQGARQRKPAGLSAPSKQRLERSSASRAAGVRRGVGGGGWEVGGEEALGRGCFFRGPKSVQGRRNPTNNYEEGSYKIAIYKLGRTKVFEVSCMLLCRDSLPVLAGL